MPSFATATEFLSVAEQSALIADVQTARVIDDAEGTRYENTPAAEAALAALTTSFLPLMEKEARRSKVLDFDDTLGTVFEEFVATLRLHDLDAGVPFSKTIGTILRRKISDTDRTSDLVVIKESVAAVYWRLLHRHDGDVAAAYRECVTTANSMTPSTFLAVHNVIGGVDSLDPILTSEDDESGPRYALAGALGSHEDAVLAAAEVEWLMGLDGITDRQRQILRLAYGFSDLATEKIRLASGYALAEVMDDPQVAHALSMTKPTVQRDRTKALKTMRAAYDEALLDVVEADSVKE